MNTKTAMTLMGWAATQPAGRENNPGVLMAQMGKMNVWAVSGGRYMPAGYTVFFPVANGYHVAVTLTAADDYTVTRLYVKAGKVYVKAEMTGVYADEVGDAAYAMSCYLHAA